MYIIRPVNVYYKACTCILLGLYMYSLGPINVHYKARELGVFIIKGYHSRRLTLLK